MSDQAVEQSPASVEQRLADWLSPPKTQPKPVPQVQQQEQPEAEVPEQAEGQEQVPEFEEVEYEGERFHVPPKLKKGLMLNQDYTQKTQQHAEKVRAFEVAQKEIQIAAEQRAFDQSVESERLALQQLDAQLAQARNIDWQSMTVEDMMRARAVLDQLKDQRSNLDSEVRRKEGEFKSSLQTQYEELQTKARDVLARKIPGWNAEVEKGVKEWAISQGFTAQEVSRILNPVHAETLYKAQQYDKLLANKSAAQAQAASAAPMGKPGSVNPMPQAVKEKLAFNRAIGKTTPGTAEHQRLVVQRAGSLFSKRS